MRKLMLICILSAGLCTPVQAQSEVGFKPMYGFLISHHNVMRHLIQGHAVGGELYYEKPVSGKKHWHHLYKLPEIGYTFFIGNLGNPTEIGWAAAGIPYIKFHTNQRKYFHFNIKTGMGVGYLSRFFDRHDNNKNIAIGSHVNIVFTTCFEPEWTLGKWDLGVGLSFIHYSNGAWKVPNLGYNMPYTHINVGYRITKPGANTALNDIPTDPNPWKKWTWQFVFSGGLKEILPVGGPKYGVYCLAITSVLRKSPISSFLFSSETYYNDAYKTAVERYYKVSLTTMDAVRSGLAVGYGLNLGRLLLSLQNGMYFYSAYREFDGSFFHRLGARYVFDNGVTLHAGLKTHFAKADNFEFGVGYTLGKVKSENK